MPVVEGLTQWEADEWVIYQEFKADGGKIMRTGQFEEEGVLVGVVDQLTEICQQTVVAHSDIFV